MTKTQLRQKVKRISETIIKKYKPEKIILFGSAVRDKTRAGGDIDLLLIKKTKKPYRERIKEVIATCLLDFWAPTDIFILTPTEFEKAKKENRFFLTEEILPKGKVVYEKNN